MKNKIKIGMAVITMLPLVAFAQATNDTSVVTNTNYCPKLSSRFSRGASDRSTKGQVSELQKFIKSYYHLNDDTFVVSGFFGRLTQSFVIKLQKERGLPSCGNVGNLTIIAINKVCINSAASVIDVKSSSTLFSIPLNASNKYNSFVRNYSGASISECKNSTSTLFKVSNGEGHNLGQLGEATYFSLDGKELWTDFSDALDGRSSFYKCVVIK